tara:strand:- start:446 stop:682 length:237 start_codon:yes stop_codon:yes gene_type:complete
MKNTVWRWGTPKTGSIVYRTTNLIATTIGIPRWRKFTIGGTVSHTLIVCAKSVLILPTLAKKLFGATINGNERSKSAD